MTFIEACPRRGLAWLIDSWDLLGPSWPRLAWPADMMLRGFKRRPVHRFECVVDVRRLRQNLLLNARHSFPQHRRLRPRVSVGHADIGMVEEWLAHALWHVQRRHHGTERSVRIVAPQLLDTSYTPRVEQHQGI